MCIVSAKGVIVLKQVWAGVQMRRVFRGRILVGKAAQMSLHAIAWQ